MEYIVYAEGKILAIVEAERVTVTSGGMTFMGADSAAVAEFSTAGIQGWVKKDAYRRLSSRRVAVEPPSDLPF